MSKTPIPPKIKYLLWGRACGRCQYRGCNKELSFDSMSKKMMNASYIAHIIADSESGPRGDKKLSLILAKDISNLMLLCDEHHRLIDIEDVDGHSVELLNAMKKEHEELMRRVTDISHARPAHVILYGANIGSGDSILRQSEVYPALAPKLYPSELRPIELGMKNSALRDHDDNFWNVEESNLVSKFTSKISPLLEESSIQNYAVFGLAPQPLLIRLGVLLNDLANVYTFSNRKEPKTWAWKEGQGIKDYFHIVKPTIIEDKVALVFSLSCTVKDERIQSVLGVDCSIWKVTIDHPNNDFMHFENHLSQFRTICRSILNEIKSTHGEKNVLHVFPAMLPSTAIEFGRVWNSKADLPLVIYDQNRGTGGFVKTITIS